MRVLGASRGYRFYEADADEHRKAGAIQATLKLL